MTESYNGIDYTTTQDGIIVLRDGMIYIYTTATEENDGEKESYKLVNWVDQSEIFGGEIPTDVPMNSWVGLLEANMENFTSLITGIQNQANSPLNNVIKNVVEYFFAKESTTDGYVFTLDKSRASAIYTTLTSTKMANVFDSMFGEGAFDATVAYLKEMLNMTATELEADVVTELARWGINKDTLYAIIENVINAMQPAPEGAPAQKITVADMLEGYFGESKLYEIINQYAGMEMALTDYTAMIDQYAGMVKQSTALEFIAPFIADMGDIEITDEMVDSIGEMIEDYVDKLENSYVKFTTDKAGWLMSVEISIDEFLVEMGENNNVFVDGDISYVINGNFADSFDFVVNEINKIQGITEMEGAKDAGDMILFTLGDDTYAWVKEDASFVSEWAPPTMFEEDSVEVVEENVTYEGQLCDKIQVYVVALYKMDKDVMASAKEDCYGWWAMNHCDFRADWITPVYVWKNTSGDIVGMEVIAPSTDNGGNNGNSGNNGGSGDYGGSDYGGSGIIDGGSSDKLPTKAYIDSYRFSFSTNLYYNPDTGAYDTNTHHNYVLVETIEENGCEKGKHIFECSVCGNSVTETFGEGHVRVYEAKLKAGATSCEDGAIVTTKCTKCNEVLGTREISWHNTYEKKVLVGHSDECGDIYYVYYECACGEENYNRHVVSDCPFDHVWDDSDYNTYVYRCPVEGCGYTYTRNEKGEYRRENGVCYYFDIETYRFGVKADGSYDKEYVYTDKWQSHNEKFEYNTDKDGYYIEKRTCQMCGLVTSHTKSKSDEFGREIYYENLLTGYKYVRVYDANCNYTETTTYEDGSTDVSYGTNHYWRWDYIDKSCTQYYQYGQYCYICGETEDLSWHSPEHGDWCNGYYQGHEYYWNGETYVCYDCDTENKLGADGLIALEDRYDGTTIKVGYYNYRDVNMDEVEIEVILNFDEEGDGYKLNDEVFTNTDTTPDDGYDIDNNYQTYDKESGIITIDMTMLYNSIDNYNALFEQVETVSVVFWVLQESVTGGEPTYLAHAITFEMAELGW